jgi:hypothetical protein
LIGHGWAAPLGATMAEP